MWIECVAAVIAVAGENAVLVLLQLTPGTQSQLRSNTVTHTQIFRGDSDSAPEDFKSGAATCIMRFGLAAPNPQPSTNLTAVENVEASAG